MIDNCSETEFLGGNFSWFFDAHKIDSSFLSTEIISSFFAKSGGNSFSHLLERKELAANPSKIRSLPSFNSQLLRIANPSNNTDGSTQVPCDTSAYQVPVGKSHLAGMGDVQFNFGSGWFGNSAVSSNSGNGYQDANGQGKFQYQPPTGCYACCTKNLNL